jgi:hypothetical protein
VQQWDSPGALLLAVRIARQSASVGGCKVYSKSRVRKLAVPSGLARCFWWGECSPQRRGDAEGGRGQRGVEARRRREGDWPILADTNSGQSRGRAGSDYFTSQRGPEAQGVGLAYASGYDGARYGRTGSQADGRRAVASGLSKNFWQTGMSGPPTFHRGGTASWRFGTACRGTSFDRPLRAIERWRCQSPLRAD